jgi:hypothetical protein
VVFSYGGGTVRQFVRSLVAVGVLSATVVLLFTPDAEAVPSFTRRYGFQCSSCHTMWGALNGAGVTFRLSGYRAMFGKDLVPIEQGKDIDIPGVNVKIPSNLPLSFITGVGYDARTEKRQGFDGSSNTRSASSLALEDASIFLAGPMGDHFSAFVEFPMYETKSWEFTPTGPGQANDTANPSRHFSFDSERPVFEVGKLFFNNLLGSSLPRDSFNGLIGITHMPLAYPSGKVRLSVNQFLIYERRALDLIGHGDPMTMAGSDHLFRLGEPQILAEVNGMIVPGGVVTDSAKRETPWFEYHLGVTNGSNDTADNNTSKDVYGRLVGRFYNQSLGFFGFYSPDQYDDNLRMASAIGNNPNNSCGQSGVFNCGFMPTIATIRPSSLSANSSSRLGIDGTLSLLPWGIPLSLDNQYMWNRESNPTGFNTAFAWRGGFHQLNWFVTPKLVAYGRYDWIKGSRFNDTSVTVSGVNGVTFSDPSEWDVVFGIQYAWFENVKLVGEFRHHYFKDSATGAALGTAFPVRSQSATLTDDGGTARVMVGF